MENPAEAGPAARGIGSAGARLAFLEFAPGISRANAWTFLYLNLLIMPIVSFLSFSQPYVLNEIVGIPAAEQGRITGFLVTMQEIVALLLVGFAGGLSDRYGRRPIYSLGVLVAGGGFALYGFAGSEAELYAYRMIYAVGVALAGVMIGVTAADYPAEGSRGKLSGVTGLLNGLGVGLTTALVAGLPAAFKAQGLSSVEAGRYMLLVMAAIAVSTAVVMQLGLKGGTPTGRRQKLKLMDTVRIGLRQGLENPRLLICYLGSFVARADLTLVATFVSLWLQQVGRNEGLDAPDAIRRAGIMFAIIQGASLLWAPVAGIFIDRFHRLFCVILALAVAAVGYTLLGLQEHPFGPLGYVGAALLGIGQMSVILTVTGLLGQETPLNMRGSVIGFAGLCGAAGILLTSFLGGYLFDHVAISAPIVLTGGANLLIFVLALRTWLRDGRPVKLDLREARSSEVVALDH